MAAALCALMQAPSSVAFRRSCCSPVPSSSSALLGSRHLRNRQTSKNSSLHRGGLRIVAEKPDFYRIFGTAVKTARDVLEAGTKLVPESVPRPLAQTGVGVVGILVVSYVLKSIFSIVLFVLAIGGVSYFIFFYLNKDDDQGNGGSSGGRVNGPTTDQTLEEARRIMEKYK